LRGGSTVSGVSNVARPFCDGAPAAISFRNILGRRHPGAIDIPPLILARADEVVE
jgi:hypothetical protein